MSSKHINAKESYVRLLSGNGTAILESEGKLCVDAQISSQGLAQETTLSTISGKLPASLGQANSASSLSVVPASDASFSVSDSTLQSQLPSSLGSKGSGASLSVTQDNSGSWSVVDSALSAQLPASLGAKLPTASMSVTQDSTGNWSVSDSTVNTTITTMSDKIPALGQAVKASSLPVVLANDQGDVSVVISGTVPISINGISTESTLSNIDSNILHCNTNSVSINGTVPVSGTFWQTTQPVSGTVSVTGSALSFYGSQSITNSGEATGLSSIIVKHIHVANTKSSKVAISLYDMSGTPSSSDSANIKFTIYLNTFRLYHQ